MDLSVWSARPFDLPGQLPQADLWKLYQDQWAFESKGWQVLVMPARPYQTDPPDLPNSAVLLSGLIPTKNAIAHDEGQFFE